MSKTVDERFDEKWTPEPNTGCWLWFAAVRRDGYGQFYFNGRVVGTHRVAWELANGPIPDGLHVLHRCDERRCVNPDHLFLGTHLDNMHDCVAKKRQCRGERHWMTRHPERSPALTHPARLARGERNGARLYPDRLLRGERHHAIMDTKRARRERHGRSKVTESQVAEIRRRLEDGETQTALAAVFGLSQSQISSIKRGESWPRAAASS